MELQQCLKRFPNIILPYETIGGQNTILDDYNIGISIPYGKKSYLWFTFENENDVCYLIDINKEKHLTFLSCISSNPFNELSIGTILYGTRLIDEETQQNIFVIEDIIMYKGITMNNVILYDKFIYIKFIIDFMKKLSITYTLCFPVMWSLDSPIPTNHGYIVHHNQYRCISKIKPYLNIDNTRKIINNETYTTNNIKFHQKINHYYDYSKPQYKLKTTFQCYADIQNDIYHLYAIGKQNLPVYYNLLCIPNYKTSVFMNKLFRNIRENINLDYIEESEDEEDFQNINIDKYIDMNKMIIIDCIFNYKFRKWMPLFELPTNNKVIHISRLVGQK